MKRNNNETELIKTYKDLFLEKENCPSWGVKQKNKTELVSPSIPFIGKCFNNTKLLLYASAENLTDYDGWIDDNEKAVNRHRFWFDNHSENRFFPNTHIAPITDGALVICVAYILKLLKGSFEYITPKDLMENIAFGNFGKFSIRSTSNKDYAKDFSKLKFSINYIKKDLEILKPEIIVLPKTIYKHKEIKTLINSVLPESLIVPIYQINSGTINRTIQEKFKKETKENIGLLSEWQSNLSNGITGKTNENFLSVYTYLEKLINDSKIAKHP
jgi:hypothetical protein